MPVFSTYVGNLTRASRGLPDIPIGLPFESDVNVDIGMKSQSISRSYIGQSMLTRLKADYQYFAESENKGTIYKCLHLNDREIQIIVNNIQSQKMDTSEADLQKAIQNIRNLITALLDLKQSDRTFVFKGIQRVMALANRLDATQAQAQAQATAVNRAPSTPARPSPASTPPSVASAAAAALWETHTTDAGEPYYFNRQTNETSWDKPDALKTQAELDVEWNQVWQEMAVEGGGTDGNTHYFYNAATGKSVWSIPRAKTINFIPGSANQLKWLSQPQVSTSAPAPPPALPQAPTPAGGSGVDRRIQQAFALARYAGSEITIQFEYLVISLLSMNSEAELQTINPFLSTAAVKTVQDVTAAILLHTNRIAQVKRQWIDHTLFSSYSRAFHLPLTHIKQF